MTNYREILRLSRLGLNKTQIAQSDYSAPITVPIRSKENINSLQ